MKAGYFQFMPEFGKKKENIIRIEDAVAKAEFDLLVIPELASSGYLFNSEREIEEASEEPVSGEYCNSLRKLSREKNAHIVSGFCEKAEDKGYYNSSILVYPDGRYKIYRKLHLFFEEKLWFRKGNTLLETHKISGSNYKDVVIGMMICFDWIFPEVARTLALKGAQILCHPSNLVMPYCQRAMYARAVENHVFIITSNRTGREENNGKKVEFTGASIMLDPKGNYIKTAPDKGEQLFISEIDPSLASNKFINQYNNVIDDRREEFYY